MRNSVPPPRPIRTISIKLDPPGPPRPPLLAALPTEGVGEPVDRHDLPERAARNPRVVAADAFEKVKSARMCFGRCLRAHPADDLFRVSQEGENRGWRGGDLGFAAHDKGLLHRFLHRCDI